MVKVLVVGGSGYLGQFVVERLNRKCDVAFTYCSNANNYQSGQAMAFRVDLRTGEGLPKIEECFGKPSVIVNCSAIASPQKCEESPELARSVNVPIHLIRWLSNRFGKDPLLIHISTDHVYDGSRPMWAESSPCRPVNEYGKMKVEAEQEIEKSYGGNHVILRSSIIYGPEPPRPISRGLFLQWMDGELSSNRRTNFYSNEFRSPIYVNDLVDIIEKVINCKPRSSVLNAGGPDRLSRLDMAKILAEFCGYSAELIVPADRPETIKAPMDVSMDTTLLREELHFEATGFAQAIAHIF